jgi:hypothetical protein
MRTICCLFIVLILPLSASGVEPPKKPLPAPKTAVPPPPPIPPRSPAAPAEEPETGLEPEVTITTRGDTRYEEYRMNGRLYMIKVTPKTGKPYYLVDEEGAGQFRRSDFEPRIAIPRWTIKSW